MKKVLVLAAGITVGLLAGTTQAADISSYSSKSALTSHREVPTATPPAPQAAAEFSSRWAVVSNHDMGTVKPQPIAAATYNSKAAARGERLPVFELAPLK